MDSSSKDRQRFVRRAAVHIVNVPILHAVGPGAEVACEQRSMLGFLGGYHEVSGQKVRLRDLARKAKRFG